MVMAAMVATMNINTKINIKTKFVSPIVEISFTKASFLMLKSMPFAVAYRKMYNNNVRGKY